MSTVPVPPVVDLDRRDFAEEATALLTRLVGRAPPPGGVDAALVAIFAGMAEQVAERINRAPEKNFVAFLDLLGLELTPPRPARVPLTFSLAKGAVHEARVPAGTLVAGTPPDGEKEPVHFETETELVLIPAALEHVLVHDSARDAWADRTAAARGAGAFVALGEGDDELGRVEHRLHFDFASALSASGAKTLTLRVDDDAAVPWMRWLEWSYAAADGPQLLPVESADGGWRAEVPDLAETEVAGRRGRWLTARLALPLRSTGEASRLLPAPSTDSGVRPFAPGATGGLLVAADAFAVAGARVSLRVELAAPVSHSAPPPLAWEYARGGSDWAALDLLPSTAAAGLTDDGTVEFTAPGDWSETEEGGHRARWLRVRLADLVAPPAGFDPAVRAVTAGHALPLPDLRLRVEVEMAGDDALPAAATANGAPLDLSKDFLPLGAAPRFGDVFAIGLAGIGDKPGAEVRVDVDLSNADAEGELPAPATPTDDLTLRWEFLVPATGRWEPLGESGPGADPSANRFDFVDGTDAFASRQAGPRRIRFTRPETMTEAQVGGASACWLRARVVRGAYGHDARWVRETQRMEYAVPVRADDARSLALASRGADASSTDASSTDASSTDASSVDASSSPHAPSSGDATSMATAPQWTTVTQTMEVEIPRLQEATHRPPSIRSLAVGYAVRSGPHAPDRVLADDGGTVTEYAGDGERPAPADDGTPGGTLLLGFARPGAESAFAGQPVSLFLAVEEVRDGSPGSVDDAAPAVAWEYWTDTGWAHLAVSDDTAALTRSGTVAFLGPHDLRRGDRLGRRAFWLRLRGEGGPWRRPPRLTHVLTNTVWATQGETVHDETLGSATGEPGQTFRAARFPVLPGAVLEVREAGWVRWTGVPDFHGSDADSRHYLLDARTGEVRFGDGLHGRVPPIGSGNVRLTRYRVGGGARGNRPAGAVTQMKRAVPYVAAVTNPLPAEGGAEGEALASLQARGPLQLRHRGRAVAAVDFEDLAREATRGGARAFATAAASAEEAGRVRVVVVPAGTEDRPVPSAGLLAQVRDYLAARASPTLEVVVTGPRWLRVEVEAAVVADSPAAAFGLAPRVEERIRAFLHPLTGGADGGGWEPGRRPHKSELYAVIEDTGGVHHLDRLRIRVTREEDGVVPERVAADDLLVFSGTHGVVVTDADAER